MKTDDSTDDNKPAGPPALSVGKVAPEVVAESFGKDKGKKYLRVNFQATATNKPQKRTRIVVKASCKVGDETIIDKSHAFGMQLDDLDVGQTKKGNVAFWPNEPFDKAPSACTLTFGTELGLGDAAMRSRQLLLHAPEHGYKWRVRKVTRCRRTPVT